MKRRLYFLTSIFLSLLFVTATMAGECLYEGNYEITDYPELFFNLYFGICPTNSINIFSEDCFGFNVNIPLESIPDDFFDEFYENVCDYIDSLPFMTPEEKEELKDRLREVLDNIIANWNETLEQLLAQLPSTFYFDQFWLIPKIFRVNFDGGRPYYGGLIDTDNGNFGIFPIILPTNCYGSNGNFICSLGLLNIYGDFTIEDNSIYGDGHFYWGTGFLYSLNRHFGIFGFGLKGTWAGEKIE